MRILRRIYRAAFGRSMFSPRGWTACALTLAVVFTVIHLLGWRDDTAIISGTWAAQGNMHVGAMRGVLYAVMYFAVVVICPVLIMGHAGYALICRVIWGQRGAGDRAGVPGKRETVTGSSVPPKGK